MSALRDEFWFWDRILGSAVIDMRMLLCSSVDFWSYARARLAYALGSL